MMKLLALIPLVLTFACGGEARKPASNADAKAADAPKTRGPTTATRIRNAEAVIEVD